MADWNQMSLMEAAEQKLFESNKPLSFMELFQEICDIKGITEEERNEMISQVYTDFILSAKFVYVGEDLWDLKSRQSIDLWDKDGAFYQEFSSFEEDEDEDEEDEDYEDDFDSDEEDEDEEDEDEEDESIYEEDDDYDEFDEDEEDFVEDEDDIDDVEEEDSDDYDEDEYNEYMDNYEDMYDK